MDEVSIDLTNRISPMDLECLEDIIEKSKKDGVQTGVTWANDVFSYLFESEECANKFNEVLGIDL